MSQAFDTNMEHDPHAHYKILFFNKQCNVIKTFYI